MSRRGIPPSLDRIERRRRQLMLAVGGLAAIALAAAGLWSSGFLFPSQTPEQIAEGIRMVSGMEEDEELTQAWAAAHRFVAHELDSTGLIAFRWPRRQHHEGHYGWYFFEGLVEFEDLADIRRQFNYGAVVVYDGKAKEWKLEKLDLSLVPPKRQEEL